MSEFKGAKAECMKVWRPDGRIDIETTISGSADHYGNLIAEKKMREEDYWPAMYRDARADEMRVRKAYLALLAANDRAYYANLWVALWLDYEERRDL